ncbi:hypothetical protein [Paenibacillus monticola]|uniref:Uncharacterized protein n=1 Tax=Paenibacillus monticola TaxID=2666075 RepID=A0A7X2HBX6_9BACL|nr:hypothetical protein [Paenibacillus monticola]MRN57287.1 hypothetical protein [Paenibacillus monticola]
MLKKILGWLKPIDKNIYPKKSTAKPVSTKSISPKKRTIESNRINIQLDQLSKDTKYISDIMILNKFCLNSLISCIFH